LPPIFLSVTCSLWRLSLQLLSLQATMKLSSNHLLVAQDQPDAATTTHEKS